MSAVARVTSLHTSPIFLQRIEEEESALRILQNGLRDWCEEKQGTAEYSSRVEAKEKILHCYDSKSPELSLVGLYLTSIPKEIGSLQFLRSIDLEINLLTSLPYEIYNLDLLRFLNLSENQLQHLPEGIHKLTNLKELNLDRNPIATLPMEIFQLEDCSIRVTDCPNLPSWVLARDSQEQSQQFTESPPIR